jgi:hypothetical protein
MKAFATFVLLSVLMLLGLTSCEVMGWQDTRCPIIDEPLSARGVTVRVQLDWSRADIPAETPDGRRMGNVWFFPAEGGTPFILEMDETLDSIALPVGNYHILIFNGLLRADASRGELTSNSFRYIGFRNTERYETFEAYCRNPITLSGKYAARSADDAPVSSPEVLAATRYTADDGTDMFRVTPVMLDGDVRPTLQFAPRRVTSLLHLTVHVENLVSISSVEGASSASVSGLAGGILLATGEPVPPAVTHFFTINHRKFYEGSVTEGTVEGYCYFFGLAAGEAATQELEIFFRLRDGTDYDPIHRDITGRFSVDEQTLQVVLNIEAGAKHLGEDDIIRLPDTPDPGGEGAGMDADIGDWGENVITDVDV